MYGGAFLLTLPIDENLHKTKFNAFADDKINATEKMKFVEERGDRILGKGKTISYPSIFLLIYNVFVGLLSCGCRKKILYGGEQLKK